MPVCCVLADLPAKGFCCYGNYCQINLYISGEVTPLKGYRADVFCGRDMFNKSTGIKYTILYGISACKNYCTYCSLLINSKLIS